MSGGLIHIDYNAMNDMQTQFQRDAEEVRTKYGNLNKLMLEAQQNGLRGQDGQQLSSDTLPKLEKDWDGMSQDMEVLKGKLGKTVGDFQDGSAQGARALTAHQASV